MSLSEWVEWQVQRNACSNWNVIEDRHLDALHDLQEAFTALCSAQHQDVAFICHASYHLFYRVLSIVSSHTFKPDWIHGSRTSRVNVI